jgi:hypothetical protein
MPIIFYVVAGQKTVLAEKLFLAALSGGTTSGQCFIRFSGYYRHDVPGFNINYHTVTRIMYVIS